MTQHSDQPRDIVSHTGHHLEYRETIATPWTVTWIKDGKGWSPERGPAIEHKAQMIADDLYCVDCDLYLTGWEM